MSRGMSQPVKVSYQSQPVEIPPDFLKSEPDDARPIKFSQIDFEQSVLPEYKSAYAVVLDHVLSPSECVRLIELAEASVMEEDKEDGSPWRPALVSAGGGYEVALLEYRDSDRIIWDQQEIVDRLWARLRNVPQIRDRLSSFSESQLLRLRRDQEPGSVWDFHKVNKRMRFLKYGKGQFFRPHCDAPYGETSDGQAVLTHYTLHLYLNDSKQEVGDGADLVGGATSFLSSDEKRKLDVFPKAGRVLIFQHKRLYHSGDDVKEGTKYTMRTDIMYHRRDSHEV
ncbi:hypothetical protein F4779DRAFT_15891 [Xylariaceae sp. FL0662B]|nr:hypothetical protein F4779DRAFT_15891 [Xylariaceae sp. FL0662B]